MRKFTIFAAASAILTLGIGTLTSAQQITFTSPAPLNLASEPGGEVTPSEVTNLTIIGKTDNATAQVAADGVIKYVDVQELSDLLKMVDMSPLSTLDSEKQLQVGASGDEVVALQEQLIARGFMNGEADGQYGQGTAGAVSAFKKSVGLPEGGTADAAALALLEDNSQPLILPYPIPSTVEEKFPQICEKAEVDLEAFMNPEWAFTYDVFSNKGSILLGSAIGTALVEEPKIDNISMTLNPAVTVNSASGTPVMIPAIRTESIGTTRPYIKSGILSDGKQSVELPLIYSIGALDENGTKEEAYLDVTPATEMIESAETLTLRINGTKTWDVELGADGIKKLMIGCTDAGITGK